MKKGQAAPEEQASLAAAAEESATESRNSPLTSTGLGH
jgi:hypothetical protein